MTKNANHTIAQAVTDRSTGAQYERLMRTLKDVRGTGGRIAAKMVGEFLRITEMDTDGEKLSIDVYPDGAVTDPFHV